MMKEYLNDRIKKLGEEKSFLVQQIRKQNAQNINHPFLIDIRDRESRIDELKEVLKYYMENKYENS